MAKLECVGQVALYVFMEGRRAADGGEQARKRSPWCPGCRSRESIRRQDLDVLIYGKSHWPLASLKGRALRDMQQTRAGPLESEVRLGASAGRTQLVVLALTRGTATRRREDYGAVMQCRCSSNVQSLVPLRLT